MNRSLQAVRLCFVASAAAVVAYGPCRVHAETPGEIPKPWTYEGSMKLQEQQRQQNQQSQGQPSSPQGGVPSRSGGNGNAAAAAAADAARARWLKQPPLPPERNPLLGKKWERPASTRGNPNDPFGQLQALAKGGLCEVLFGGGVFEFQPDRLVGMDAHTPPQEMDRVEYRGDARHVVVLPKTTLKLMEFDVDSPDRIHWQDCVLVRAGKATAADAAPAKVARSTAGAANPSANPAATLTLSVAAASSKDNIAGRKLWVLKADPQFVLIKGGLTSTPYGTPLQNWMRACYQRTQVCDQGVVALKPFTVGIATTDSSGHAQTPPLPTGRYWVLSDAKIDDKHMMWNQPVDVKGAAASVTLDGRNAMPVE